MSNHSMGKFGDNPKAQILYDNVTIAHGAIAALDVEIQASSVVKQANERGFRILKSEYFVWTEGYTVGEGPVMCGMAGPNLTAAEIEQAFENAQDGVDIPNKDVANYPIWLLDAQYILTAVGFESRMPREKKVGWSFPEGTDLIFWVYNPTDTGITGGELHFFCKHYGVWLND